MAPALRSWLPLVTGLAAGLTFSSSVMAQQDDLPENNQAVVQSVPPNSNSMNLNAALMRLGRNPRDLDALIDAGSAALTIGDVDAAIGFYSRADQVSPGNGRVKSGLARAIVQSGNPYDAIPLFDEAERAGLLDGQALLDRGLAYDLVGDNARAQKYYRDLLLRGPDDEAARRLAVSLAIAGDKKGSSAALSPLLMRHDMAAWRARAFSLAILNQQDEAQSVVNSTLPPALSSGIGAYLRYMPRLTPAQQAAAANLGQFPRASEIGRDDPRIAQYSSNLPRRGVLAVGDAGLIPQGEALGRKSKGRDKRNNAGDEGNGKTGQGGARIAIADPLPLPAPIKAAPPAFPTAVPPTVPNVPAAQPVRSEPVFSSAAPPAPVQVKAVPAVSSSPVLASATPAPTVVQTATPAPVVPPPVVTPAQVQAQPVPVTATVTPAPAPAPVASAQVAPAPVQVPVQVPVQTPAVAAAAPDAPASSSQIVIPTPSRQPSLSEAFSDLAKPAADVAPARGAVDIRRIKPVRDGANAAAKPAPPSHPSRIWVQLATGRDKKALGFDWRRMLRESAAVFKGKQPSVSSWGQTNRLLTGPFESEAAANSFIAQLRRADIDGAFVWTSPAGQVVDALAAR